MARTSYTSSKPMELSDEQLEHFSAMIDRRLPVPAPYIQEAVDLWRKKGREGSVVLQAGKSRYVSDDDSPGDGGMLPMAQGARQVDSVLQVPRGQPTRINNPTREPVMNNDDEIDYLWVHGVQGTGAQTAEVKPTDPIVLADIEIDSDDATARIISIKQGSREFLGYTGYGIRASAFNKSGFARRLFRGILVSKTDPLNVGLVHAGSGTNTSTITLLGNSQLPNACSR